MKYIFLLVLIISSCHKDEYCRPIIAEGGCCDFATPEVVDLDMDLVCDPPGCDCDTTLSFGEYYTLYPVD
jgi:hypothetical protein